MDRQSRGERTPDRNQKQRLDRTGEKMKMKDDPLVESKYQLNENGKEEDDRNNRLDEIEAQIKKCGKRLQEIHQEERNQTDKYSERFLELQHERTELKKRVIDLDFEHKVELANSVRESRRREADQKDKAIKQAQEQRERRKKELDERYGKFKEQKSERKEGRREQQQGQEQGQEGQRKQGEGDKKQSGEDELARSRRKLRIAEIEAELAQSRLRRSRMAALNSELDYLRATYSYPYWTWRDYSYPYSLSPYLYSPYSYPYTSALYPYSSSYLYPYSYSSYVSPFRYRWWP